MNPEKAATGVVCFAAVGDIMFGDSYYCIGRGVRSTLDRGDAPDPFEKVRDIFTRHDVVVGNLEAVLSDFGLETRSLASVQYRGRKSHVRYLAGANISVLNVANNHILQHGWEAARETDRTLRTHGMHPVGLPEPGKPRERSILVGEWNGVRLAFLGYCLNKETFTTDLVPDVDDIVASIQSCRGSADRVIVMLHWGREYVPFPSPSQISLAHRLIDAGADIILGHHPHVLQGIEEYKGKLIAYSLGNFVFDNDWNDQCRSGMILSMRMGRDGPVSFEVIPTHINQSYQPVPLVGAERTQRTADIAALAGNFIDPGVVRCRNEEEYDRLAGEILRRNKKALHRNIIRQLPNLPVGMAAQILAKPIQRRLNKFRALLSPKRADLS